MTAKMLGGGGGAPPATLSVSTGTATSNSIPLTWVSPVGKTLVGATPYKVYVKPFGGSETLATTTGSTSYTATGLAASTVYTFRVTADILDLATGSGTATTAVAPAQARRAISMDGVTDSTFTNVATQSYALRIVNTGSAPIYGAQIWGRNTISGHAQILGAVLGSGSVNNTTMSSASYVQAKFGGVNTKTPANGSPFGMSYWETDDTDFPTAIAPGASGILRITVAAGPICYPDNGIQASRTNHADLFAGWADSSGDYGSTPAAAASNPSWNSGVAVFPFGVILRTDNSAVGAQHAAFGDSVVGGVGNDNIRDRWTYTANAGFSANRKVVSFGRSGYTVAQFSAILQAWLATPMAALFSSASLSGWSWNELDTNVATTTNAIDAAIAAGVAAGKKMSVWFPTPAGLQMSGYGNNTVRAAAIAHCTAQGYTIINTSALVADGGDPTLIAAANSADGVHLNQAGQDLWAGGLISAQNSIFV